MRVYQIRSRGQGALFAGIWLLVVVPLFQVGALVPQGFGTAAAHSASANNYAPLVAWASQHIGLVIVFPLIEVIPLIFVVRLPALLREVIYGAEPRGRVGQWCGTVGVGLIALVTLVDLVLLVAAARQYTPANAVQLGASVRFTSIAESMISDIAGGILLAIWLISANVPLVRLTGFERVIGVVGVLSAALFAAVAALILFNPQQPQGAIAGTGMALFGVWLILIGFLLIRRAPALGTAVTDDSPAAEPTHA